MSLLTRFIYSSLVCNLQRVSGQFIENYQSTASPHSSLIHIIY
ncbi:hypothetical protein SPHINGO8BC_51583 [Sphingobacterium multivorum]|uniref:Uncharacterized protein n=1 Tax=Sphingobacterium multivorum TaxID=28454 RepID=A0A654D4N1_SPHMU|nr:hypothetical protein SPHINGO8BC_51583 [Sphingobacterium multivorum]